MDKLYKEFFRNVCIAAIVSVFVAPGFVWAATSNGCDKEGADYISPELALCSTHAYNIGHLENPKTDAERSDMKDVIALKTTVMTQQMYKQYEYLEAMTKRFKTQLEKAVLTTKLESAGAASQGESSYSSGTSSFKSSDRNIFIAGVSNCNNELTNQKVFECLNTNLNSIYNASNNGQNITIELRKQLANDYAVALRASGVSEDAIKKETCANYQNISQRTPFQSCLDALRAKIRTGYEAASSAKQKQNLMNSSFGG